VNDNGSSLEGFEAPIHRSLTEPILMGEPRAVWPSSTGRWPPRWGWASSNGSRAGCLGDRHTLAVFAARRDPDFAPVLMRHLRQRGYFTC
jgi:type IV secretion system protein VirB3